MSNEIRILVVDEESNGSFIGECLIYHLNMMGRRASFICKQKKFAQSFDLAILSAEWLKKKKRRKQKILQLVGQNQEPNPRFVFLTTDTESEQWVDREFQAIPNRARCHSALVTRNLLANNVKEILNGLKN